MHPRRAATGAYKQKMPEAHSNATGKTDKYCYTCLCLTILGGEYVNIDRIVVVIAVSHCILLLSLFLQR